MKKHPQIAAVTAIAGAVCLIAAGVAVAGSSKLVFKPMSRSNISALQIGRALMQDPTQLAGAKFVISPPKGTPRAIGYGPHEALDGFPRYRGNFAILSTGCALRANKTRYKGSNGCVDYGREFRGTRDTSILKVNLNVPKGASCLSLRFRFLSNEYPKYVGSEFNDAFIAELGSHSTWRSSLNDPTIHAPDDFAKTPDGRLITINATGYAKVSRSNAAGTGYDAATRVLRASSKVRPGRRTLFLSIFDQGDRQFDSAVFIDQLALDNRTPCKRGVAPDQH